METHYTTRANWWRIVKENDQVGLAFVVRGGHDEFGQYWGDAAYDALDDAVAAANLRGRMVQA